jgi:cyclic-di-GMP phosphodiesterase, flagellum assembly factor TipF
MTRQLAKPQPSHERFSDAFVILSVTILSLASGAWLISNLGLELSSALLASLAIYCVLLLLHLLVRRAFAGGDSHEDFLDEDPHWHSAAGERFAAALAETSTDALPQERPMELSRPHLAADDPPPQMRSQPGAWPEPLPMPPDPGAPEDEQANASDLFTFRPSRSPYFEDGPARDWAPPDHAGTTAEDKPANTALDLPEVNVEIIQDLIKKLADELNGAVPAQPGGGPELPFPPEARAESMLDRSVEALETTAHGMRTAGPPPLDRGERHAEPWPRSPLSQARPSGPPMVDPQLARIAEAIAAERIEVLLEPIQGLTEGRARHYEVSIRLRAPDGATLDQKDVARLAEGSGLMPRIDAMRMARAVRVAQRLGDRGRSGALLTATAGESLTDAEFLDAVAVQPGTDGRISLVLSFSQSDVRTFTPAHAEALGSMAAAGFGFALEDVTDLDMDFGRLKAMGFEFIKLDAEVFLDGLQAPSGRVPAADICRFLSEFGLTLIVGRIEDDWLLARILGFGVLLGKGTLFGGAKLVKSEVVADRGVAAA